jgi:hypothetical protein
LPVLSCLTEYTSEPRTVSIGSVSFVLDNRLGPDAKVGDIINVTKDTEPIDTVLGSEVYSVKHERTGKEIVVSQEDLFPIG